MGIYTGEQFDHVSRPLQNELVRLGNSMGKYFGTDGFRGEANKGGSENGCQTAEGTETGDYRCHCDHCGPEGVDDPGCGSDHSS